MVSCDNCSLILMVFSYVFLVCYNLLIFVYFTVKKPRFYRGEISAFFFVISLQAEIMSVFFIEFSLFVSSRL